MHTPGTFPITSESPVVLKQVSFLGTRNAVPVHIAAEVNISAVSLNVCTRCQGMHTPGAFATVSESPVVFKQVP
jgi:hypothetical protein